MQNLARGEIKYKQTNKQTAEKERGKDGKERGQAKREIANMFTVSFTLNSDFSSSAWRLWKQEKKRKKK